MAFSWFLKLAFKCLDHFAWPLLALGYPLLASVQAIETDSHTETRDLISYWILLSLIYLFEYAFTRLLQWFQFWPYIKLMIIFWLIIPDFGRASFVYNNLIRTCIFMKPKTVIRRLNNYLRQFVVEKDNFLLHAETYIKENGTEALEKIIASKNTMYKPKAEATNAIRATGNKEMQQTNDKILQTEHKDIKDLEDIEIKENPAGKQNTMYKPKAEATNAIRATDNKEMQQTNDKRFQTEHKDIKDLEVIEKREIPAGKQDIPAMPNLAPSKKASSAIVETKAIAGKDTAGGELPRPQSSTHKEVQKEWTCALCQITASSEKNLNSHLLGKKHRDTCEALKAKNQHTLQKPKICQSKEEMKQKNIINQLNSNAKNRESIANNGLKGKVVMDHKVQDRIIWSGNLDGTYSAKEGYKWIIQQKGSSIITRDWRWIWQLPAPEMIKSLLWLEAHDSAPTMKTLSHRGISQSDICKRCNNTAETFVHSVRDCTLPQQMWLSLGFRDPLFYAELPSLGWMHKGMKSHNPALFLAGVWTAWTDRNAMSIAQETRNLFQVVMQVRNLADLIMYNFITTSKPRGSPRWVTWHPSGEAIAVLNVDGSSFGNTGRAGVGGLLRHGDGEWIQGFYGSVGVADSLKAELAAIWQGLSLAWLCGARDLVCYTDSSMALSLLRQAASQSHAYAAIIGSAQDLLRRPWNVKMEHSLREGNSCADSLARMGAAQTADLVVLDRPPPEIGGQLLADAMRVRFQRAADVGL